MYCDSVTIHLHRHSLYCDSVTIHLHRYSSYCGSVTIQRHRYFYTVVVFELEVTNELFIPETKIKKTLLYLIIVMWCNFSIPYGQEQLDGHHAGMASTGKAFFHCKAWKIFL